MAWMIIKSAGDDYNFITTLVPGNAGHSYLYAQELAHKVTAAMKATQPAGEVAALPAPWPDCGDPGCCPQNPECNRRSSVLVLPDGIPSILTSG